MPRLSLIVPAATLSVILAVSTASTSGRAMMQSDIPQASGIPQWCGNDTECWDQRRPLCKSDEATASGENLLMCMRGTRPAKDERAGADPTAEAPGATGSQRARAAARSSRRRADRVTDRRGTTRSQSQGRQDRRQDARRRARQGRPSVQVRDRRGLLGLGWSERDKENLDRCVDAMLLGPGIKKIKIAKHEFNCPVQRWWQPVGNLRLLKGELDHHLSARKDDRVRYEFTLARDGSIGDFNVNVKKGGLFATINKVAPLNRINERLDPGYWTSASFSALAGQKYEGKWRDVASIIVLTFANRLSQSFKETQRRVPRNSNAFFYYVNFSGSDIRRVDLRDNLATPEVCQRQCSLERNCKAWTFFRPKRTSKDAQCFLKDSIPRSSLRALTVSGLRPQRRTRPF